MLTVISGTPGAAKSLYVVSHVDQLAKADGRPVFYAGIPGVTLEGWSELQDVTRWHEAAEGAIVVLDETSRTFPARSRTDAEVPAHVRAMDDHRHRGHDVFVVCQHTTQIDTYVRKMAGCHIHLKRMFGGNRSALFEWSEIADERNKFDRKEAARRTFKFPKEYFGKYKSASLHTVKARLPWRLIVALAFAAFLIPLLIWVGFRAILPDEVASESVPVQREVASLPRAPAPQDVFFNGRSLVPVVSNVPWSAPFYSGLVEPAEFPRFDGCMRLSFGDGRDRCTCNDQQGNRLSVSHAACLAFFKFGSFDFSGSFSRPSYKKAAPRAASEAPRGGFAGS